MPREYVRESKWLKIVGTDMNIIDFVQLASRK